MYDPANDGVDHLNVYSKGKTVLGRFGSNFAHAPFMVDDGRFASVEGYWFWLGTHAANRDELKALYGNEAKKRGTEMREIAPRPMAEEEFKDRVRAAIRAKFERLPSMLDMLRANRLPLAHYYVWGEGEKAVAREAPGSEWILEFLESLAREGA